jgi:hypothetical protein
LIVLFICPGLNSALCDLMILLANFHVDESSIFGGECDDKLFLHFFYK